LSTIIVWPSAGVSLVANNRAWMSVPPPAAKGTIMRITRVGTVLCRVDVALNSTPVASSATAAGADGCSAHHVPPGDVFRFVIGCVRA